MKAFKEFLKAFLPIVLVLIFFPVIIKFVGWYLDWAKGVCCGN